MKLTLSLSTSISFALPFLTPLLGFVLISPRICFNIVDYFEVTPGSPARVDELLAWWIKYVSQLYVVTD